MKNKIFTLLAVLVISFTFTTFTSCGGQDGAADSIENISAENIPEYSGEAYTVVNDNIPEFTESDFDTQAFETYGELDEYGRCTASVANIGPELMPTEERTGIGMIKPTGWHTVTYENVDGRYLYNRCHLIGFQLTGENANEQNLITGTRYMNVEGMLPFEDMVADYIHETQNHVLYRVTPIFEGDNLLASGVHIEAMSVEDSGEGICCNVYVYNVQPGIDIDYATGDSHLSKDASHESTEKDYDVSGKYILNTNTMKYHRPECSSVDDMSTANRREFTGSTGELERMGYEPCGRCRP